MSTTPPLTAPLPGGEEDPDDSVKESLKRACQRLHVLASQRNTLRKFTSEEITHLRNERKQAGRALRRGGARAVKRQLTAVVDLCLRLETEIRELDAEPRSADGRAEAADHPSLDEAQADHPEAEKFEEKLNLVLAMKRGATAREALEDVGIDNRSPRWARRLYQRYREEGVDGLLDGRARNGSSKTVMVDEVVTLLLAIWLRYSASNIKSVWRRLRKELRAINEERADPLPIPSYQSVYDEVNNQTEHWKLIREGGLDLWDKKGKPVAQYEFVFRANQRWQSDHARLNLWVREWEDGGWVAKQVWITVFMDAHSRAIAGFEVRTRPPNAALLGRALLGAIRPKSDPAWPVHGVPEEIQTDNGTDYTSLSFRTSLAALHIDHVLDPPYHPQSKGRVERWFRTLDEMCLRLLDGHMEDVGRTQEAAQKRVRKLVTVGFLRDEIHRWIVDEYHARVHSTTEKKPAEHWEETVRLDPAPDTERLQRILLKRGETRIVQRQGIQFNGGWYWNPEIIPYLRREVDIRYDPDDTSALLVFELESGDYICEARSIKESDAEKYLKEIKAARREYREGLKARLKKYHRKAERLRTQLEDDEEWDGARADAAEREENAVASTEEEEQEDVEIRRLMEELRGGVDFDEDEDDD